MSWTKTFTDAGEWQAKCAAEKYLTERGFSVGRHQGPAPRGILLGDYAIQKWRNLSPTDRSDLHGEMRGDMRNGPVTVEIYDSAPDEARAAIGWTAPACAYCDGLDNVRMRCDGGGFIAPDYVCAECFKPRDDGPCFDDLPAAENQFTSRRLAGSQGQPLQQGEAS